METLDVKNYLHIEILEILEEIGVGVEPYNSHNEAYFPVTVKWRPITYTPRLVPEDNNFSVGIVHIEEYIKSGIKPGIYKKIMSAAPSVPYPFIAVSQEEVSKLKVA